jgi:hypothetical protein
VKTIGFDVKTDRLCQVTDCDQPMPTGDNSTACPDCWAATEQRIAEMPSLITELETTLSRQTVSGTANGSRSNERPLPYSIVASDALRLLHVTIWPWVKEGLEAHPDLYGNVHTTRELAHTLLALHGWLVTHPEGNEVVEELCFIVEDVARPAIDRAPDKAYAGQCQCGEELYVLVGQTGVLCPVCGSLRDVMAWRRTQLEAAADRLLTVAEMTRAIAETGGETVSRKRIEGWIRRGRLLRTDHDRGIALYRVGDVLDILANDMRRAV